MSLKKTRRILCVEDHHETYELVCYVLAAAGYEVVNKNTYEEALAASQAEQFSLFLLDRFLPDGDGIDLCDEIHHLHPITPIMILTADSRDNTKQKAIRAGATYFMTKPCDFYELLKTVTELITQAEGRVTE